MEIYLILKASSIHRVYLIFFCSVFDFIGVKKAERRHSCLGCHNRDVLLIAVRPDSAASAPRSLLPLLAPRLPPLFVLIAGGADSTAHPIRFQHTFTFVVDSAPSSSWELPTPPSLPEL